MYTNFLSGMMIFWFVLIIIGIVIFIALIVAIFEINNNIKSIKDYIMRNEYIEGRRLEPQEDWIYEDEKKVDYEKKYKELKKVLDSHED